MSQQPPSSMGQQASLSYAEKTQQFIGHLRDRAQSYAALLPAGEGSLEERYRRFVGILWTNIRDTPKLLDANYESLVDAALRAMRLGLEPGAAEGLCYLIPRKQDGSLMVNLEMGYKGFVRLLYQHPRVIGIETHCVHEEDRFDVSLGSDSRILHKPELRKPRGPKLGAYAVIKLQGGASIFDWMTAIEINEVRQSAQGTDRSSSPWNRNEDEMWKKTVLKRAAKYAPTSTKAAGAVSMDDLGIAGKALPTDSETLDLGALNLESEQKELSHEQEQ